ncbi:MAG: hypothetical protein R2788_02215 [Saprospiraceae bacterium]
MFDPTENDGHFPKAVRKNILLSATGRWPVFGFEKQDTVERKVTAVYEDLPTNSHFKADFLLAMNGNQELKKRPAVGGEQ